jgi:DNA-binding response OmpR family regulator
MTTPTNQAYEFSENEILALIIEDDPGLATIFARALSQAEYKTIIIPDGNQALRWLATTKPAMVILDLHLPYVSGVALLQRIRSDTRLAKTRVIVTTADALRAEDLILEADLILLKPVGVKQLRDLAARLRPPDVMGISE